MQSRYKSRRVRCRAPGLAITCPAAEIQRPRDIRAVRQPITGGKYHRRSRCSSPDTIIRVRHARSALLGTALSASMALAERANSITVWRAMPKSAGTCRPVDASAIDHQHYHVGQRLTSKSLATQYLSAARVGLATWSLGTPILSKTEAMAQVRPSAFAEVLQATGTHPQWR
jgi:hypothetical protein